jgi:murein DD-endopeptidase MepM/ murein hydrolase activator NlpD
MPGHSAEVARSRETLTQNIVRLDSLERKMNEMLLYNENRLLVVSGKTPAMQSAKNDSLSSSKKFVGPSQADAQLRNKIENDEQYRLVGANANSATPAKLNTVAPMYGIITKRFNTQGYTGVDVKSEKDAVVSAIAEGVVVSKELASDSTYCVMIQHKDNYLSIYRNLANALISKGERVQSAQDVGYAQNGEDEKSVLKFELWCDGKAVNPEQYIEF